MSPPDHGRAAAAAAAAARRDACIRSARIALGIAVVTLLFIVETSVPHHVRPNDASPFVWTVLGTVAVVSLARAWLLHRRARATTMDAGTGSGG